MQVDIFLHLIKKYKKICNEFFFNASAAAVADVDCFLLCKTHFETILFASSMEMM